MKPKILYVEDDHINALVVSKFLEPLFDVDLAVDGESSIAKCEQTLYDLVLMDINLGPDKMNGVDTMRLLRKKEQYKPIPFVAFTAYALPEDEDYYLGEGFDLYLAKPADKQKLIDIIQRGLSLRIEE